MHTKCCSSIFYSLDSLADVVQKHQNMAILMKQSKLANKIENSMDSHLPQESHIVLSVQRVH